MTDATNPPIQVLGTVRAVASNVDLEIIRESSSGRIAWQYADSGCPACPSWPEWSELRRDPYVALGWVSYDDDGVPTWTGPGSDRHVTAMHASPFAVGDRVVFDNKRNDDLPVICIVTSARRASPSSSEWVYDISSGSQPFLSGVTGQWLTPDYEIEQVSDEYVTVRREDVRLLVSFAECALIPECVFRGNGAEGAIDRTQTALDRTPAGDAKE